VLPKRSRGVWSPMLAEAIRIFPRELPTIF
jgi:hypothetical protein